MNTRAPSLLLAFAAAVSSGALLLLTHFPERGSQSEAAEFQRLIGGLGFGPALDISRCDISFDPRLGSMCPESVWPIPGSSFLCPHHASSIFSYGYVEPGGSGNTKAERDAEIP